MLTSAFNIAISIPCESNFSKLAWGSKVSSVVLPKDLLYLIHSFTLAFTSETSSVFTHFDHLLWGFSHTIKRTQAHPLKWEQIGMDFSQVSSPNPVKLATAPESDKWSWLCLLTVGQEWPNRAGFVSPLLLQSFLCLQTFMKIFPKG